MSATSLSNEGASILRKLILRETRPQQDFQDLVESVISLMDVPTGYVSVIDDGIQYYKARSGFEPSQAPLDETFCQHTILGSEPVIVPDATLDPRFADHPLVTGEFNLRFYCGVSIVIGGQVIGTVCAGGSDPKQPTDRQVKGLTALARQAAALMEARAEAERANVAEEQAREMEKMLLAAAESSFDTFSILAPSYNEAGVVTDFVFEFLNDQSAKFFGTSIEYLRGRALFETFPTENCRHFVSIFIQVLETGESFEVEYVSQMPGMMDRWARMKVSRAGGRIAVTGQDIHDRRLALEELQAAKGRLTATFDAVQVGIMVISADGIVLRANPEAEKTLGLEPGRTQFVSEGFAFDILHLDGSPFLPEDRPIVGALRGKTVRGRMMRLRWPSGREMCISANAVPLFQEGESTPYAAVCSFLDVTTEVEQRRLLDEKLDETAKANLVLEAQRLQLQRANERLAALATTDGLTGLLNHRAFQELLDGAMARARRTEEPISLLLLDVDHFKQFNDDFGHQTGDAVLKEVAGLLSRGCREGDVVARYGGEEFVVVMPGLGGEKAWQAANRLRLAIETAPWEDRGVTVSIGVAVLAPDESKNELIRAADEALYASKRGGRNQVTLAEDRNEEIRTAA